MKVIDIFLMVYIYNLPKDLYNHSLNILVNTFSNIIVNICKHETPSECLQITNDLDEIKVLTNKDLGISLYSVDLHSLYINSKQRLSAIELNDYDILYLKSASFTEKSNNINLLYAISVE